MEILLVAILALVIIAVFGVIFLKYRLVNTPDKKNLETALDAQVKKLTRGDLSFGLVIGIYKDEKTFIKGYGTLNRNSMAVPDGATIFQLASVTKLLTASTYQILSDEHTFDMDATLLEVLDTTVTLSPQARKVTLRQLATHTSGFPKDPKPLILKITQLAGKKNLLQNPFSHIERKDIFDYLKTTNDKHKPSRFKYSNFGMGLLGHVLEIVTKENLESLISTKLLTPLGMTNTTMTLTPEMNERLAQGYADNGEPRPVWTFSALAGAGAFNSNAEDMMKFIRANIEDNSELSHSLKKTHERQFGGNTGIGWMQPTLLDRLVGNQSVVWHNGMVGGYASYVSIDTKAKIGIVILSNKAVDVTMLGMMLTRQTRTQSWAPSQTF